MEFNVKMLLGYISLSADLWTLGAPHTAQSHAELGSTAAREEQKQKEQI